MSSLRREEARTHTPQTGCPASVGGDHTLSSMMCIKFFFYKPHIGQRGEIARGPFISDKQTGKPGARGGR